VPTPEVLRYRDLVRRITPRWLHGRVAGGLLYALAVHVDALGQMLVAGVKRRFPGAPGTLPDALPAIGRERKIRRGPNETDASYAARLPTWLEARRLRGGPYAMLRQVRAFYGAAPFAVDLIYRNGRHFAMAPDGTITRSIISFSPDAFPTAWARWWMIYRWPETVEDDGIWSDPGTWEDGGVWDSSLTAAEVAQLALIPTEWNAAHTKGYVLLATAASTTLDPAHADIMAQIVIP
jgi:hypothetical protein